jgi:hypothetical protein
MACIGAASREIGRVQKVVESQSNVRVECYSAAAGSSRTQHRSNFFKNRPMKSLLRLAPAFVLVASCVSVVTAREGRNADPTVRFERVDANDDERLSEDEFSGGKWGKERKKSRNEFRRIDDNADGWLSRKEYLNAAKHGSLSPEK